MGEGDDIGDSFDFSELTLDEDFVRGAPAHELSAEDRQRRARRIAVYEDEFAQREKDVRRAKRPHRRAAHGVAALLRRATARGRGGGRRNITVVAVVVVIAGLWWYSEGGTSGDDAPAFGADAPVARSTGSDARPTPQKAATLTRLEVEPDPPAETGPYQFLATQQGSAAPVAYDPCRTIPIVVNNRTLPKGAVPVFNEALLMVSRATGLRFQVEGTTDEVPTDARKAFDAARYGDRWAPVLVAWSDPEEYPRVAGNVAGTGGSTWVDVAGLKTRVYVTGQVVLDGPALRPYFLTDIGRAQARAVIVHEVAHLVGLHHVEDPQSIMSPEGDPDIIDFAPGDLHGLAELGTGPCIPIL